MNSSLSINLVADLVVAAVLFISLVSGKNKGFIKSVAGVVVTIVALVGANWLTGIITEPITDFVFPKVEESVLSKVELKAIDTTGMDIVDNALKTVTGTANEMVNVTARAFVQSIVHALAFIVCFILLKLLLQFIVGALDKVAKLPLLNSVNNILGAAFGLVEGCLILFLVPYVAKNLGIDVFEKLSQGTYLLDFFVHSSPFEMIHMFLK